MSLFINDKDRSTKLMLISNSSVNKVGDKIMKFFKEHPEIEVLHISHECTTVEDKMVHSCWLYYREAPESIDDSKRI